MGLAFVLAGQHPKEPAYLAAAAGLALGIGIQNFPEGAAISLPVRQGGAYPSATSKTIINKNPAITPIVPKLLLSSGCAWGSCNFSSGKAGWSQCMEIFLDRISFGDCGASCGNFGVSDSFCRGSFDALAACICGGGNDLCGDSPKSKSCCWRQPGQQPLFPALIYGWEQQ